jgi:hypothetical protein
VSNESPRRGPNTAGANDGNDEQKKVTSSSPIFQQRADTSVKQLAEPVTSNSSANCAAHVVNSKEEGHEARRTPPANPDDNDRSMEIKIGTAEDYYLRTHRDKGSEWKHSLTIEFEGETYLVHPNIADVKRASERKIRPLLLVRCVNVKGREQIWPIKLDRPGKKRNDCNASALMVAERMREEWLMLVYDHDTKTYFGRRPVPLITDTPKWTQRTFPQLRDLAFPEDRRIDTLEHEVWRKLASGR